MGNPEGAPYPLCNPFGVDARSLYANPGRCFAAAPLRLPWAIGCDAFSVGRQAFRPEEKRDVKRKPIGGDF